MKKILFSLVALVCSMSMNAQVMKVMKGNYVVATYKASQADNVVFEEEPVLGKTGTAKRTDNIDVKWVQLWENGPRFAEYNVGVTDSKAESYGGYYCWGKSNDQDVNTEYKDGTDALTGDDDTATKLWGSNWRMPTQDELQALCNERNCTKEWTTVNGKSGYKFTGKGDYDSNSVFLPAAGQFDGGRVVYDGDKGYYWSSTPYGSLDAWFLYYDSDNANVSRSTRDSGYSVRAVLAE